jgi:adenosylcobyric acid synthase
VLVQLGRPAGSAYGAAVAGYEIHHGIATVEDAGTTPFLDGCRTASTWGTSWHGTLENDAFRRAFLAEEAELAVAAREEAAPRPAAEPRTSPSALAFRP